MLFTDVNECLEENGMCSHTCFNLNGSHYCECPRGYHLEEDGRTCAGMQGGGLIVTEANYTNNTGAFVPLKCLKIHPPPPQLAVQESF